MSVGGAVAGVSVGAGVGVDVGAGGRVQELKTKAILRMTTKTDCRFT